MLNFAMYLATALVLWVSSLFIYKKITPYNEIALIKEGNISAGLAYSGVALGLAAPLSSLAAHAVSLVDMGMWAVIALIIQLALHFALSKILHIKTEVPDNNKAVGLTLGAMSLAIGLINAACLTY